MGEVAILNVSAGDTKLTFDPNNPAETERASKTVKDMLRRGYAILIEAGKDKKTGEPLYRRAHDFDPETNEYIIAGAPADEPEEQNGDTTAGNGDAGPDKPAARGRRGGRKSTTRVPAEGTKAVAVARTAGG